MFLRARGGGDGYGTGGYGDGYSGGYGNGDGGVGYSNSGIPAGCVALTALEALCS